MGMLVGTHDGSEHPWTDIEGVHPHLRPLPRVVPLLRVLNNSGSHIVLCRRRGTDGISHPRVARAVPRWCTTRKASTQIDNLIEGKWNSVGLPEAVIAPLTFMGAFTSSTVAVIQRSSSTRTRFLTWTEEEYQTRGTDTPDSWSMKLFNFATNTTRCT